MTKNKETKADFIQEKDVLGQDIPKNQLNDDPSGTSTFSEKQKGLDHSRDYELPSIKTRYFSVLIDVLVIVSFSLGISSLFEQIGEVHDYLRAFVFVVVILLYEPMLISTGCTIGQLVMNIRVKKFRNPKKKLWFINAIIRLIAKALLGWLSFITVTFNKNHRAIHDYLSGSIVIIPSKNKE